MPGTPTRSPLRFLAPVALVVCAVLFVVVLGSALGGGKDSTEPAADTSTAPSTAARTTAKQTPKASTPATYTVKAGDDLGKIAEKVKLPVEKLQELNPDLDPQALVIGQKVKLRE